MEVQLKKWNPIKISNKGPNLSHLFFADDLILMSRVDAKNCDIIQIVLDNFCNESGHSINYGKSKLTCSKNCNTDLRKYISNNLGIKIGKSFGKYLRFPIFNKRPKISDYQFIIDNLQQKLVGWKTKFLNIAERTTLAKSSLNNIPTHVMQYIRLQLKSPKE